MALAKDPITPYLQFNVNGWHFHKVERGIVLYNCFIGIIPSKSEKVSTYINKIKKEGST